MLEELGYFGGIGAVIAVILLAAYWAARAIDHYYRNRETDREYAQEAMLQADAFSREGFNRRQEAKYGYAYARRLQEHWFAGQQRLNEETVRQINDRLWNQIKGR